MRLGIVALVWFSLVWLAAGCSAECPHGRVAIGAGCECPVGTAPVGDNCRASQAPSDIDEHSSPTGGWGSSGSRPDSPHREDADAGLSRAGDDSDAAVVAMDASHPTVDPSGGETPALGNDGRPLDPADPARAQEPGQGAPPPVMDPASPPAIESVTPPAPPIAQSVVPTCESSCKTKRCDAQGRCLECVGDADCTSPSATHCSDGRCVGCTEQGHCAGANRQCSKDNACVSSVACGNGNPDPGEECDDANQSPLDGCIGCRNAYCGDGHIREGHEQCEPGVGGYNTDNCIKCQRKFWRACSDAECPTHSTCFQSVCAPNLCRGARSACGNQVIGLDGGGLCPALPEFAMRAISDHCVIACREGNVCPPGLTCIDGATCGVLR